MHVSCAHILAIAKVSKIQLLEDWYLSPAKKCSIPGGEGWSLGVVEEILHCKVN